jgi:hypothetical protein
MGMILKLLAGSAGPYIAGALAVAFAGLLAFGGIQTARLDHAKADQINPATGAKWKAEAKRDAGLLSAAVSDLAACRDNVQAQKDAIALQNGRVDAWKAEAERMAGEADKARQTAALARRKAERTAAEILAARPGADVCQSIDALIMGESR